MDRDFKVLALTSGWLIGLFKVMPFECMADSRAEASLFLALQWSSPVKIFMCFWQSLIDSILAFVLIPKEIHRFLMVSFGIPFSRSMCRRLLSC